MIFSYNWLKQFVPNLPAPHVLLEQLTLHSVEVEGVIDQGAKLTHIVIGEITEIKAHPQADRLQLCLVNIGSEIVQIVCGGSNLELNMKVVVAKVGAQVVWHGVGKPITLEKTKIRGEVSYGMICAADEIGLLHLFPKQSEKEIVNLNHYNAEPGTPLAEALGLSDYLLDIDNKSMTHRSDLFCHRGLAREIAAVFDITLKLPDVQPCYDTALPGVAVNVTDSKLCPRYSATKLDVIIQPTPQFILERLQACGIKAINNVVDIANYCMLEYGQPMHAFDAAKISGAICVRKAKNTETLMTLMDAEDTDTKLNEHVLVIADDNGPLAVAGVIGGRASAVSNTTQQIVLEVANFDAVTVRKSAQFCGVRTDSALRYEKGLPAELVTTAAARAVELLVKYAAGRVTDYTDVNIDFTNNMQIELDFANLERLTGQKWKVNQVKSILERLECKIKVTKDSYVVTPPWFRKDLKISEDIIEEIVRIYGVANIPEASLQGILAVPKYDTAFSLSRDIKHRLNSLGLTEVLNYSFYGDQLLKQASLKAEDHIAIANPLSADQRYLRTTLLPRLLETVAKNQSQSLSLFEVGHVYFTDREIAQLVMMIAGGDDVYRRTRGYAEVLLQNLSVPITTELINASGECVYWQMYQGKQALKLAPVGTIGIVDAAVLKNFDIKIPVAFAVLSIPELTQSQVAVKHMSAISAYPAIPLDLSIIVDEAVVWQQIEAIVRQQAGELLQSIDVFDVYHGSKIPEGKKSLAFHVILQAQDKTLEMEAMEQWRDSLVKVLAKKFGAELRAK